MVFADLESARSTTGMQQAVAMVDSAIYAIRTPEQRLDWEDRLRLRITCGPEIFRRDDKPFTNTKVTVLTVRAYRARKKPLRNPLKHKRRQRWHNDQLNQQIATIAEAFATRNAKALNDCGIRVDEIAHRRSEFGEKPRVAILVESPEHARALRLRLPHWPIRAGSRLAEKNWPEFPLHLDRVIVTRTRAMAAGLAADVVIRADGTEVEWQDDFGPHYGFNREKMLIVDLVEAFDPTCRKRCEQRQMDYRERGWNVRDCGLASHGDSGGGPISAAVLVAEGGAMY